MRRRLKRRGRNEDDLQSNDEVSVSSPPRLRRDSINKTSSNREFSFNLEQAGAAQVIDADDSGGGTISTVTNDVAFRDEVFRCGFDNAEYGVMKQTDVKKLQLQTTDVEEFGINNKGSTKKKTPRESPMGVNELNFPDQAFEWADLDSNNKGSSKATEGPSSAKLNLGRNLKKDDDTFFYSASVPSEATSDTKLVGETITLGSTSSYLHSFDILDNGRNAETEQQSATRPVDTRQLGMGRGSPLRQPSPRDSSKKTRQTKEEVHKEASAPAAPSPSLPAPSPPKVPRQRSKKPIDQAEAPNNDESMKPGCAVPEIVQEFVDDVTSVLSQVITAAYWACSEGEQCLSRCQSDEPESTPQPSQLNTIVKDSTALTPNSKDESKRSGSKPWAGDYLGHRTGTEETADNSNSSQEADGTVEKRQGSRTHRLKKFLTSFKTRK